MPPASPMLTPGQILTLARGAGFSSTTMHKGIPEDRMAVAIALGESKPPGNPFSHNPVAPDDSYGLWQINMLGELGPERRAQFGISSNAELYKPTVNARAAKMVFDQQGFRAWSVYTSGSWMRHRAKAMNAKPEPLPEGNNWDELPDIPGVDIPNPLDEIGAVFSFVTDPNNWKRVALFIAGGITLIIATIAMMDRLGAGKTVSKAVNVVPAGRVLRTASKAVK